MKSIRRVFFIGCLSTSLSVWTTARAVEVVVGTDIPGVGRMSGGQQAELLESLHAARVGVVRAWIGTDMSYEFIRQAYALGIRVELTLSIGFGPNAPRRATIPEAPWMYGGPPLSAADVQRTQSIFRAQLDKLQGMGVVLVAFELGNELNNPSFNGEFVVHPKGVCSTCRTFGSDDLEHDPEARAIAAGLRKYVELLAAVKELRDNSRLNRRTPVLLGGLADEGPEVATPGSLSSRISVKGAITYMRKFGLDGVVDGYGIHSYPWSSLPDRTAAFADIRRKLAANALSECRPAGSAVGKPCWITEWGFKNTADSCPMADGERAAWVREFMTDDLRPYVRQGSVVGLLYFVWQRNPGATEEEPFSIFRCGGLTESGRLALDQRLLR